MAYGRPRIILVISTRWSHAAPPPHLPSLGPQQCGFATIEDVEGDHLTDRMESFFLSETLKYLYLLFDPASPFHNGYVFTTEGSVITPHLLSHSSTRGN